MLCYFLKYLPWLEDVRATGVEAYIVVLGLCVTCWSIRHYTSSKILVPSLAANPMLSMYSPASVNTKRTGRVNRPLLHSGSTLTG